MRESQSMRNATVQKQQQCKKANDYPGARIAQISHQARNLNARVKRLA